MIIDINVLDDRAFSFEAMHNRIASDGDGAALFAQWASTLTAPLTINGFVAQPRQGFTDFVAGLPRLQDGHIDLAAAGFRATAFVNRLDILRPGDCGESRVVYTKESGAFARNDRMTIIFEFVVPDDGSGCENATARWTALRGLQGDALREAAVQLMLDNSRPEVLGQMRINDFINAPFWELREFHLDSGVLVPAAVADTPPFELARDPALRTFVRDNANRFNAGAREREILPTTLLAPASRADGERFIFGQLVPSLPGLDANFNVMTCSGCHLTETGTGFVHVGERTATTQSNLSQFLLGELEFRAAFLETVAGP